jgi:hypothetical protein
MFLLLSASMAVYLGEAQVVERAPRLRLTFNPPVIPADGRSYQNIVVSLVDHRNEPLLALSNITVHLTSSRLDVGVVQETVQIPALHSHAIATFKTTTTPGSTLITAEAMGVLPDTQELQTVIPTGFPVTLRVFSAPKLLQTGGSEATIFVQLQDVAGNPAPAGLPVQVTLSASPGIVSLHSTSLSIPEGSSLASTIMTTGFSTGTVTISASAIGFNSDSTVVRVVGPVGEKLVLHVTPPSLPPDTRGVLTVQLQSLDGQPVRAPHDIRVDITSDNSTVASPRSPLIIRAGETFGTTHITTGFTGRATLTATAQGYAASKAAISVLNPSANPDRLRLYLAPELLLPDNRTHTSLYVQVQDSRGNPALALADTTILVASSDNTIGTVTPTILIPRGASYAVGAFTTTYKAGSTTITVSAEGLKSDSLPITTFASLPTKLLISSALPILPADGNPYPSIYVQLLDQQGNPANAPMDLAVFLSTSRPDVGTPPPQVTIRAGRSYTIIPFLTTLAPGSTNITASILGFDASVATQQTVEPAPSRLAIYTLYPVLLALDTNLPGGVVVQLQDSAGRPARARVSVPVTLVSSNSTLLTPEGTLTIWAGSTFGASGLRTYLDGGSVRLTAAAQGYVSATTTLRVIPVTRNITLSLQPSPPRANQTATLTVTATLQGRPLTGAAVTWSLSFGEIVFQENVIGPTGRASATIFSPRTGPFEARARIHLPGVINRTLTLSSTFLPPPTPQPRGPTGPMEIVTSNPALILTISLIPVLAALAFILYRRSLRRRLEAAIEEAEGEEPIG